MHFAGIPRFYRGCVYLALATLLVVVLTSSALRTGTLLLWGSTLLLILATYLVRRFLKRQLPPPPCILYRLLLIGASVALTWHALATAHALPVLDRIKSSPDLSLLYLLLHYALVVWLVLDDPIPAAGRLPAVWPVLFLYSSYLYLPTFFALEYGTAYPVLYAVVLGYVLLRWLQPGNGTGLLLPRGPLRHSLLTFLALLGLASLLSPSPGESLNQYLQFACFGLLPFLLARDLNDERAWRAAAVWAAVLGGLFFVVLAGIKFGILAQSLGPMTAMRHRLSLTTGGANLIARSLVTLLPLGMAFLLAAPGRRGKLLWAGYVGGLVLTTAYTVSTYGFGGWLALALGVGALVLLLRLPAIASWWRDHPRVHGLVVVAGLGLIAIAVVLGGWLAVQVNSISLSARLYIWRTALEQVANRPLVGSGLNARHLASPFGARVIWEDMGPRVQSLIDNPLSQARQKRHTTVHTHNLFFELAVGAGLLAMLAFLWFLWALARHGLASLRQAGGLSRVFIAACIAGIVGTLAWGLLDVTELSPPFFTFPTWVLVGLLLAAPRAFGVVGQQESKGVGEQANRVSRSSSQVSCFKSQVSRLTLCISRFTFWTRGLSQPAMRLALLCLLAVVVIVLPLFGNLHYRAAYADYQERRWATAVDELAQAARWEPLNAKYHQLRGESLINLGLYPGAISAYGRASRLKREFAPYHAQLGWLYWLQGDLEQATMHFEQAVEMDPREAWRDGLHADLGLAYMAQHSQGAGEQGGVAEALRLFKQTIELDPQMALAPYWVPVQREDGGLDVVLDPVYLGGPSPEMDKRILSHLGKADHTPRLFDLSLTLPLLSPSVSLNQVLDYIEADYEAARAAGSREAPRLLATAAETARLVGLHDRAERAYLAFQEAYPESAYGFRDLGGLYRERDRLEEAQAMLERAVQLSPRDAESWLGLAEVYLHRGMWEEAEGALDTIYRWSPLAARLYELWAQLHQKRGDSAQAADALHRSLVIQESVPNRLLLAELYRQLEQPEQAIKQCVQAMDAQRRMWPYPLDPALWEIGVCLAQSDDHKLPEEITTLAREHPLLGNVLLGHLYRARGQLEQALTAYQAAADARPDEGAPHYFLGETYQALGQTDPAQVEFRRAAQLDPLESLPLLALGRLQWSQGQQDKALESFDAAVEATPGWGQAYVALGNALLALGDPEGAAQHYQQAQIADGDVGEGLVYDFAAHLAGAKVASPGPDYVRNDYFAIDGDQRRVLFMHPDSRVEYIISVPDGAVLAFQVATAPESWQQPGDGVTFAVYVESDQDTQQILTTYIDPKHDQADRRWHPYTIDLGDYAGQTVTLIFETSPGPAGDYRYDWAGWGVPRLLKP